MWSEAQKWEKGWWNNCSNTLKEELKQLEYAKKMGLELDSRGGKLIIKSDKSIIDIGGGPVSMLLKVLSDRVKVVVDPIDYPNWVKERYDSAGIDFLNIKGEDLSFVNAFNECWIYNCLQHVEDWKKIIENAKKAAKIIRIFEWIEIETNIGHIHKLTKQGLDEALGKEGQTESMNSNGCYGLAYFNVIDYEKI